MCLRCVLKNDNVVSMMNLTKQEILSIIELRKKGLTNKQIADELSKDKKHRVHPQTITRWATKLRSVGYEVEKRVGKLPILDPKRK